MEKDFWSVSKRTGRWYSGHTMHSAGGEMLILSMLGIGDHFNQPPWESPLQERRVSLLVKRQMQEAQCRPFYPLEDFYMHVSEFPQPVFMCFVDLEKAFNCLPQGILSGVLWDYEVLL